MDDNTVEIYFLKYKSPDLEARCLESVFKNTNWPFHLHVVDNRDGIKNMATTWNYLLQQHTHYFFNMFIDSDTVVSPNWLTDLMEVMLANPDAGVVVPRTDLCGESRQMHVSQDSQPITLPLASGFCFLFHKSAWLDCGKFNSQFGFYGQDSEWFIRMVAKTRWKIYLQPKCFVHHEGSYSVRKADNNDYDFEADKKNALKLFWEYAKEYGSEL